MLICIPSFTSWFYHIFTCFQWRDFAQVGRAKTEVAGLAPSGAKRFSSPPANVAITQDRKQDIGCCYAKQRVLGISSFIRSIDNSAYCNASLGELSLRVSTIWYLVWLWGLKCNWSWARQTPPMKIMFHVWNDYIHLPACFFANFPGRITLSEPWLIDCQRFVAKLDPFHSQV